MTDMSLAKLLSLEDLPDAARETIQAHVETEEAIVAAERRFGVLGRAMTVGLIVTAADGTVVYVNDALARMIDVGRAELLGRTPLDLASKHVEEPPEVVGRHLRDRSTGATEAYEVHVVRPGARSMHMRVTPFPLFDPDGSFMGSFAVIERKNTDEDGALASDRLRPPAAALALDGLPDDPFRDRLARLSDREREVLHHRLQGRSVGEIAKELSISHHTVRNHLKRIYGKLEVRSEPELLRTLLKLLLSTAVP